MKHQRVFSLLLILCLTLSLFAGLSFPAAAAGERYVRSTTLDVGDRVVIYNPSYGVALSAANDSNSSYRAGVALTPGDGAVTDPDAALIWTVEAGSGGFLLSNNGNYLSIGGTSLNENSQSNLLLNGLHQTWTLQSATNADEVYLKNATATYNTKPQYLEYYSNHFASYGMNANNEGYYAVQLYVLHEEPGDGLTRARWIQKLVDAFGMTVDEDDTPDNYFSDLMGTESYYRAIMVATNFGIVDIEEGLPFAPNAPADREFVAHTLNYCLGYLPESTDYAFAEAETVTWPNDVQVAVEQGWFALEGDRFLPEQAVTVGEADGLLEMAAAVLLGEQIDVNYDGSYVFAAGVTVLPENTDVFYVDETTLEITDCDTAFAEGMKLVVYLNGVPCAYTVESCATAGSVTTLTVSDASGENLITEMDDQGEVEASFTYFTPAEDTELVYVNEISGEEFDDAVEAERSVRRSLETATRGSYKFKRSLKANKTIKLADGAKVTISFTLKDPVVKWSVKVFDLYASVYLTGKYELSVKGDFDLTKLTGLSGVSLYSVSIPGVGGLDVSTDVSVKASINGKMSGKLKIGVEASHDAGFRMIR